VSAIGSDFVSAKASYKGWCSECERVIEKGADCLVSLKNGKVRKRVCGEACRINFDARFWQAVARRNERHRRPRREVWEVWQGSSLICSASMGLTKQQAQNKIDNEHRLGIHMTMKMVYV
jgi:hypothetical protein